MSVYVDKSPDASLQGYVPMPLTTQTPADQGTESAKLPRPKPARSSRAFQEAR